MCIRYAAEKNCGSYLRIEADSVWYDEGASQIAKHSRTWLNKNPEARGFAVPQLLAFQEESFSTVDLVTSLAYSGPIWYKTEIAWKQIMFRTEGAMAKGHYWTQKNSRGTQYEGIYFGDKWEPDDDRYMLSVKDKEWKDEPYPCPISGSGIHPDGCVPRSEIYPAAFVHYSRGRAHMRLMEYYRLLDENDFCRFYYIGTMFWKAYSPGSLDSADYPVLDCFSCS